MSEIRHAKSYSSIETRSASVPIGRKFATAFLAMLTVSVMIVWLSYLGWGVVALVQWILHHIISIWSPTR
jgi:hypothetical protein